MRSFAHIAASSALVLTLTQPSLAQVPDVYRAVADAITPERLDAHSKVITSYERPSGSAGENAAIDYVVAQLRAAGVPVEVHEFMGFISNPVSAHVTVPGTDFDPSAITAAFSGATDGIEGQAVDLGTLRDLPGLEVGTGERLVLPSDADLPDVRGKIVLVTGQPRNIPTTALEAMGAAAVIFINPEERLNDLIVTSTWGTPSLMSEHRLPTLPVAQIKKSDGDALREMMSRGALTVRVATEVEQGWAPLRLPVARVMPEGADDATPYVLLGGHIDGWYYAGTDEGASNAAMLEMAIAFHENRSGMRRGLVVAWWPGHSNARYGGSTWFADQFFEELRTRGVAYMNIDGVGQMGAKRFSVSASPALTSFGTDAVRLVAEEARLPVDRVGTSRPGRNSDQAFNGIGLPLLQFNHTRLATDGGYWWWHTPDDTYDKIDFDVLAMDTDMYTYAISRLVTDDWTPIGLVSEVDAMVEALERRQAESGNALDLSEAIGAAERLSTAIGWSTDVLANADPSPAVDMGLQSILRPIHRIMFVPGSDHHPDPGIYSGALPGLESARVLAEEVPTSDRYRFAEAQLIRERNRILEAIAEATQAAGEMERLIVRLVG